MAKALRKEIIHFADNTNLSCALGFPVDNLIKQVVPKNIPNVQSLIKIIKESSGDIRYMQRRLPLVIVYFYFKLWSANDS